MSHDVSLLTLVSSAVLFPCVASFFFALLVQLAGTAGYKCHAVGKWHLGFFQMLSSGGKLLMIECF